MATIFKLIIEDDEGKTTVVPLHRGELSIGRMEGNTIRLMERNVSRRHAKLVRENGAVLIEDLNSFNGVKINGERIESRIEVKEGDLVEIGDYHLALQREELSESESDPAKSTLRPEPMETVPDARADNQKTVDDRREPPTVQSDKRLPPFPSGISGPGALSATIPDTEAPRGAASARTEPISVLQSVADHPRIICVTTEHAGREFALNRPEVVIGRVEDNDIVIEHRSVSRNHAKIVFDGRAHKIIDLESANGILVNGEEYAITDLRKGDVIELGHVCFRYIPAGEAFEPTAEEAKSILEAGVTPPKARVPSLPKPQVATDLARARDAVALDDLSNAQTVTDTPISALDDPKPAPVVEAPRPRTSNPPPEPRAPEPPKRPAPPPAASHARAERKSDPPPSTAPIELQALPKKKSPVFMIVGGLLVVLAGVVAFALSGGKSSEHDQQLKALFDQGKHAEVVTYFESHIQDFADQPAAFQRVKDSQAALREAEKKVEPPPPPPPPDPEVAPEPEEPPEGEPALPEGDDAKRKAKAPAKKKPNFQRAQELEKEGTKLLVDSKLDAAERMFLRCLEMAEHAPCHRQLGIIYAQQDRTRQSIEHYEKYVELSPNAKDAAAVRELIKKSKGRSE